MITNEQVKNLKPGAKIDFGGPGIYEVVRVEGEGDKVKVILGKDDGDETFATARDLEHGTLRGAKLPEPVKKDEEPKKKEPSKAPEPVTKKGS